jgi:putative tryptophan/tyrosine transport system substrate-binding protein
VRRLRVLSCLLLAACCSGSGADARGIVAVLGQELAPYRDALDGIRREIPDVDVRVLPPDAEAAGREIETLRGSSPDIVIAIGARASKLVAGGVGGIPVLVGMVLGREWTTLEGAPIGGVLMDVPEDEQLRTLRRVLPGASRCGVLYDPGRSAAIIEQARSGAARVGIELVTETVRRPEDVPGAYRRLAARIDALWIVPDSTVVSQESFEFIIRQSAERRLPVMVFSDSMVKAGALLGIFAEPRAIGQQLGQLARRLAAAPVRQQMPVEAPRAPVLSINLRTAAANGIEVPPAVLTPATRVYR